MEINEVEITRVLPYPKNPRNNEAAIDKVAASIREFGFRQPIVVDSEMVIIVGHTRHAAARRLNLKTVPVHIADNLTAKQIKAYRIADNRTGEDAQWDEDLLALEIGDLQNEEYEISLLGFTDKQMRDLLDGQAVEVQGLTNDNEIPDTDDLEVSQIGDIWILGSHRVMCGDSTNEDHAKQLMGDDIATLIHADPPYGMGKEKDGVENDNIYAEKLDAFQMEWWNTFRPYAVDNGSAYIWGTAEDLWRLWFLGGLMDSERLTMRNEIAWMKDGCIGQYSDSHRQFPTITERCLFFMFGSQNFGNINTEDYWDGWDPIRLYLKGEADKMEWGPKDIRELCGVQMYSHWFTKSQWTMMPEKHYITLQDAANGEAFTKQYIELRTGYSEQKKGGAHLDAKHSFDSARAFFNNTHDKMSDVWEYPKVVGDDRHGHATPKPVEMIERAIKSSTGKGDVVIEPFGGSGSTLIACEKTKRHARVMEITPAWVDVIVRRWQAYTGESAVHDKTGKTFDETIEI